MDNKITSYVINLAKRKDRFDHIVREFSGKEEFELKITPAIAHRIGAIGLWQTINKIIKEAQKCRDKYVIICEDDHQFTESYDPGVFKTAIALAIQLRADILSGGVSWFDTAIQVDKQLFWVNYFSGAQFLVIFRKFYEKILDAEFNEGDAADFKLSSLTDEIFVTYPFVSVQREFGYSDVTEKNGEEGRITELFESRNEKLSQLYTMAEFYGFL